VNGKKLGIKNSKGKNIFILKIKEKKKKVMMK
jgi:hypothetical protein